MVASIDVIEDSGDGELPGLWEWYFRPAWHSLLTWPLGVFYVGGMAWTGVLALAINWDLIRWNFVVWLFFCSTLFQIVAFLPFSGYWFGFLGTGFLWTARGLRRWWGLPIQVVGSLLLFFLAGPIGFLLAGWVMQMPILDSVTWTTTGGVLDLVGKLHIWVTVS